MDANVIRVFSAEQASRLTGLSSGRLRRWADIGFFPPEHLYEDRRDSRVYSFRDVVGLRTLRRLRDDFKVTLKHLREVAEKLSHLRTRVWDQYACYVVNREVHVQPVPGGDIRAPLSGQTAMVPVIEVINDVEAEIVKLRERTADQIGQIVRRRNVVHNQPIVAGTRIPVELIKRLHKAGYSAERIRQEYPTLTPKDIRAAIEYSEAA